MRMQLLVSMLVAFLLLILTVAYVHAELVYKGFYIQTYKHRACVLPPDNIEFLPDYAHTGLKMMFWHLQDTSEIKHTNSGLKFAIKNCRGAIQTKKDSCDWAIHFEGVAPSGYDNIMKCSALFESAVPKCRAHYDQKMRECDAIRIILVKTAEKTSTLSKKSQWEELVPSDELPPGWEELIPSDAHLYGEDATSTSVPNRKRDRKTRKDQKDQKEGPAGNWKQWEKGTLPGKEKEDMGKDRKRGDMPYSGDSGAKFQDTNPSGDSGPKFRDPNPSDKSGVDLKDLIRLEEREMLEEEKKEYGTLGSPGGVANQGGAMDRSGRTGRISQSCKRAQQRVTRSLTQNQNRSTGSACGNARLYLQVLQYVRGELARSGCPAYAIRAYDKTIAQTRRVAHARCN